MSSKILIFSLLLLSFSTQVQSQLPDSCKLSIGTNLNGISDYGTEIPFVDLMKTCREWYTKSIGDPDVPFDSEMARFINLRPDGYPTHLPQSIDSSAYPQSVATIWAVTDGWPAGEYTILWEGSGSLSFWGSFTNLQQTDTHRITFDFLNPVDGIFELTIDSSEISDPIHHIRVLMPGTESTYESHPFYQPWLDKLEPFRTIRFMDWGATNGWGVEEEYSFGDSSLVDWVDRSHLTYYTWTHSKGIPYEMMVKLMNDYDKDGWVCVPHSASEDYIRKMARYFRDHLEPERHIYVEYSNEIWNWIFPQANWLYQYGCVNPGVDWPEGLAPYVQNMLTYWTEEYAGQLERTTRVVGIFTAWLDVAQRVAFHIDPNTFDVISPTYYFGFREDIEPELDTLAANATVTDVASVARRSMQENFDFIVNIKTELADSIHKPLAFYEGGQHLTPEPFGEACSYEQALLDVQRDTAMYNMYNEWFDKIRSFQEGDRPLLLMNYAFVGALSAQYGSWGLLETVDQDTSTIPAPKYQAVLENMNGNCSVSTTNEPQVLADIVLEPNPTSGVFSLRKISGSYSVSVQDATGTLLRKVQMNTQNTIDLSYFPKGLYFISIQSEVNGSRVVRKLIVQ